MSSKPSNNDPPKKTQRKKNSLKIILRMMVMIISEIRVVKTETKTEELKITNKNKMIQIKTKIKQSLQRSKISIMMMTPFQQLQKLPHQLNPSNRKHKRIKTNLNNIGIKINQIKISTVNPKKMSRLIIAFQKVPAF